MADFSKELAALSSGSVARNRAFFETLSVSQLSARNSRGPGRLKPRPAAQDGKKPERTSGLSSSSLGASAKKPTKTTKKEAKKAKKAEEKEARREEKEAKKDKRKKSVAGEGQNGASTAGEAPAPRRVVRTGSATISITKSNSKSKIPSTPPPREPTASAVPKGLQPPVVNVTRHGSVGDVSESGGGGGIVRRDTAPVPAKRAPFSKGPGASSSTSEGENGVHIDHEAGIIRLPPSLAPGAYRMDPEMERKRQHVIRELMHTETEYATQLKAIVQHYLLPMRENGVVSILEHSHIFSNLEILMLTTVDVSKALESRKRLSTMNGISGIGDIFLSKVDEMIPVYSNYCSHQKEALATLEKLKMKEKKAFVQFCEEAKAQPGINGLELDALIIKPTQRICKYPLLFKELMRYTPKDHPDYVNLERTQESLEKLVEVVNENSREANNLKRMRDVEASLTNAGAMQHIKLLMPGRHFIHDGRLTKISGKNIQERQFFLFSDMLMYGKPIMGKSNKYEFKGLWPLDAMYFTDLTDTDTLENAFEVGRSDLTKKYILFAKEKKTKYHWLQQLGEAKERLHRQKADNEEIGFRMQTDKTDMDTTHQLKLVDIQNRLEGGKDIVQPDRKFVREGQAKGMLDEDRYLYLFSDILVVAKARSAKRFVYKDQIPMDSVAIASLPDTDVYEHAIEFVRMDNQKKYQFKLSSAEEKEGWLRDVDMVTAELLGITRDSSAATLERKATYSVLPKYDPAASEGSQAETSEPDTPEKARDATPTALYRQSSSPATPMSGSKEQLKKSDRKKILKHMHSSSIILAEDDDSDEDQEALEEKKKGRKWDPDSSTTKCRECDRKFTQINRRHHCRNCGKIFCGECTLKRRFLKKYGFKKKVRVCDRCFINPDREVA